MKRQHHIALGILMLILLIIGGPFWYRSHYSMKPARAFEVGSPTLAQRVLIATQGSAFKDALLERIIAQLKLRPVYVRVIDVSGLGGVRDSEWSAIVVIHPWQNRRPQADAKAFVDRAHNTKKLVIVTTSGSGREKIPGIDVISAASDLHEAPTTVADVMTRLDALLSVPP
jgi:hypothetical protein